ncbi:Sec-independent protein translocase protein TatB [Rhodopila sp.]|uniref:Sec-independent protein translocase protein TatB n=1 Tax=Rhodopila sp. TaxID=2480087 RepID=UPI003D0EEAFE
MFDFAWSEIVLIGAVALIAIGPKDMPAAIRTVSSMIKKARRMAAEFQTHVDEMVREADLGDVKKAFNDIRNFDIPGAMEKAVDPDRSLRNTFASNPLEPTYPTPEEVSTLDEVTVSAPEVIDPVPLANISLPPTKPAAPAWLPPDQVPLPAAEAAAPTADAPAFIPPDAVLQRHARP